MFKGVITDLDGTLLDKNHFLSEYTKNVLNKFLEKGYKLYIATGRVEKGARVVADTLVKNIPLITTNGARILDENGKELYSVYLPDKVTEFLTNLDYKQFGNDIFINGYSVTKWFVVSNECFDFYSKKRKDKIYYPEIVSNDEFKDKKYNKIFFIGNFESLKKLRAYLEENIKGLANIAFVSENSLEIFSVDANKMLAAKMLIENDGLDKSEVIAFGDGLNDFEMLSYFDTSFVMDNALDELKEKLPHKEVIPNSHLDSVAKKIEEVFNL